jgi:hypothetical protein
MNGRALYKYPPESVVNDDFRAGIANSDLSAYEFVRVRS